MLLDYIPNINIIIKIIFIILITIYILIEIIRLTIFSYKYIKSYHYGRELKKNCKSEYIEYETERYQIYNKILDNLLDYYNESNNLFMLIFILIYGILLSLIISYIIYDIIKNLKKNNKLNSIIFDNICLLLIIIGCLISIIYIPLMIGLKFDKYKNNYNEKIMNILLYILIGIIISIIILYIKYYKSNNNESIRYNKIFIITLISIYIGVIYYIKNVIDMYIYNKNNKDENSYKNYEIKEEKKNIYIEYLIKTFGLKYYNKKLSKSDLYKLDIYIYILQIVIIVIVIIFILNKLRIIEKLYNKKINLKEFIKCIRYKTEELYCNDLIYNDKEIYILYNIYLKPFIYIYIILILINATKNINENINNKIIIEPLIKYKNNINKIRNNFKYILDNKDLKTSIKQNYANIILLVLYNDLFHGILHYDNYLTIVKNTEDKEEIINDIKKHISELEITPEFKYRDQKNVIYTDYNNMKEYDINYYLNNKCKNESIFKNKNSLKQCSIYTKYIYTYIIKLIFLDNNIPKNNHYDIEEYDKYKENKRNKIYKGLNNINKNKNYLGNYKITNNYKIDNKIELLENKENIELDKSVTETEEELETLKNIIDEIIDIYILHIIEAQKVYYEINKNTRIEKEKLINDLNNHYIDEKNIEEFLNKYIKILNQKYYEINIKLSDSKIKINEDNIKNEIIKNYNIYNNNKIYDIIEYKDNNNNNNNNNINKTENKKINNLLIIILIIIYILSYNLIKVL
jgi:hypothetical protein|tara:strand:+ start:1325 stop:3562 length:2238 start_codon:yes stop_codon:yes gene_type:complete